MDFAKQEITSVRALLIKALPYEEEKIIGKLFTRELGLISALWYYGGVRNRLDNRFLVPPVGIRCEVRKKMHLHYASNIECAYSFSPVNQSPHFDKIWQVTSSLITATQGEQPAPALWDLVISTLTKEKEYRDWKSAVGFVAIALCEASGFSIEELFSETSTQQLVLDEKQQSSCLELVQLDQSKRFTIVLANGLLERLVRFVGIKTETEELLKFSEM